MTSPAVAGASPRVLEPHRKALFNIQLSERISKGDTSLPTYSSVKFNHKPSQTTESRTTTLAPTDQSNSAYELTIKDKNDGGKDTVYRFTGQKSSPKKSYVLLFDTAKQSCVLEPLSASYNFNLRSKNDVNLTDKYPPLPLSKSDSQGVRGGRLDEPEAGDDTDEPDPNNPYDFRHFLKRDDGSSSKDVRKKGTDSEFGSSPDYRTGTDSASNTPSLAPARRPPTSAAPTSSSRPVPATRKRKSPAPDALVSKKPPTVRIDRKATTKGTPSSKPSATKPASSKPPSKPSSKPSSKPAPKSAEIIHSSDESDEDTISVVPPSQSQATQPASSPAGRSPTPSSDEDDNTYASSGGLLIEVPDEKPGASRRGQRGALASLGLGNSLGLGLRHLRSPSNGPISLHSAANSVDGSPDSRAGSSRTPLHLQKQMRREADVDVIDFGSLDTRGGADAGDEDSDADMGYVEDAEGEDDDDDADGDDRDVEPMDIGPPAQAPAKRTSTGGGAGSTGVGLGLELEGMDVDDQDEDVDDDDDFTKQMMEALQREEESSEESEEE